MNNKLDCSSNTAVVYRKDQSHLHLLRRLRSFRLSRAPVQTLFDPLVASTPSCAAWVESHTGTGGKWQTEGELLPSWTAHLTPSRRCCCRQMEDNQADVLQGQHFCHLHNTREAEQLLQLKTAAPWVQKKKKCNLQVFPPWRFNKWVKWSSHLLNICTLWR